MSCTQVNGPSTYEVPRARSLRVASAKRSRNKTVMIYSLDANPGMLVLQLLVVSAALDDGLCGQRGLDCNECCRKAILIASS